MEPVSISYKKRFGTPTYLLSTRVFAILELFTTQIRQSVLKLHFKQWGVLTLDIIYSTHQFPLSEKMSTSAPEFLEEKSEAPFFIADPHSMLKSYYASKSIQRASRPCTSCFWNAYVNDLWSVKTLKFL